MATSPQQGKGTYSLRGARVPDDIQILLELEDAAAGAANTYVYDNTVQSTAHRGELVNRGLAEYAPPYAQLLTSSEVGGVVGLLVVLDAPALARRRLSAALALRRGTVCVPAQVAARIQTAGATLVRPEAHDAYLSRIAVVQACEGLGLGSWLLDRAVDSARSSGATRLLLDVAADNARAISLYRRQGFVEIGRAEARDEIADRTISHFHFALVLG